MLRNAGIGLAVGIGVGSATTFVYLRQAQSPATAVVRQHAAFKYGQPDAPHIQVFEGYVSSFDPATRNPRYVIEHLNKDTASGEGDRANVNFYEDESLEPRFRSHLSDFKGSGYDRGHLAPAADHKGSQKAMLDTFSLSNISPQVGKGFNRDYWARFERFVRQLASSCKDVYIITGPLYLPTQTASGYMMNYPLIGQPPQLVAVPTHFYKVILGEGPQAAPGSSPDTVVAAFVLPNQPIEPGAPLTAFAVPVSALEEVSGLRFFERYLTDERREALDVAALGWQRLGRQQMAQIKGLGPQLDTLLAAEPLPGGNALPAPAQPAAPSSGTPIADPALRGRSGSQGKGRSKKALAPLSSTITTAPPLTGPGGKGATHLCEFTACKLPAEDWFQSSGAAAVDAGQPAPRKLSRSTSMP